MYWRIVITVLSLWLVYLNCVFYAYAIIIWSMIQRRIRRRRRNKEEEEDDDDEEEDEEERKKERTKRL